MLLGLRLVRTTEFKPDTALAIHYAGLAGVALVVWLSDGRESPYTSLFLIWMAVAGASHPPRRTLGIIAATSLLATLPFFYDDWSGVFAGDMALRLVIWSALTLMACVWTTHVRMQRADLIAGGGAGEAPGAPRPADRASATGARSTSGSTGRSTTRGSGTSRSA